MLSGYDSTFKSSAQCKIMFLIYRYICVKCGRTWWGPRAKLFPSEILKK